MNTRSHGDPKASAPTGDSACSSLERLYAVARLCLPPRLRRLGAHADDIEDHIQEIVLIAHRKLDRFVPLAGVSLEEAWRRWLGSIARRLVSRGRQRLTRRGRLALRALLTPEESGSTRGADPEALASAAERRRILDRVLRALPPERTAVLILSARHGLSAPEIARALVVNENTVKSRLHRALDDARAAVAVLTSDEQLLLR